MSFKGSKTWVEISRSALVSNAKVFRCRVRAGVNVMAVVKSNAYGHGLVEAAKVLQPHLDWFGVDNVDEGLALRRAGIRKPILMLLEVEKTLVEGAGAAGLAAVLQEPARFAGRKVGLVLCGGNIDPLLLAAIIQRGMVRAGRLARLRVGARDVPGSLARIAVTVAEAGGNVEEVHHQRAFSLLAAQNVEIELVLQTRGPGHVSEVLARLQSAGFEAVLRSHAGFPARD